VDVNVALPLLLFFAVFGALATFARQLWLVLLPLVAIPLFHAGLRLGWWGAGVGDGWQYAAALVTLVSFLGSILGLAIGRLLIHSIRH
jgi:hypothetical protein